MITQCHNFRSEGIISKLINGGDPAYIRRNGLIESVKAHLYPLSSLDEAFLNKSEFISFTEDISVARKYCSYDKSLKNSFSNELVDCDEYFETRYIFHLDISNLSEMSDENGLYVLKYKCNQEKRRSNGMNENIIEQIHNFQYSVCEQCKNQIAHFMILIDTVKFLESNNECRTNDDAIRNAKKDKEWLVLPRDYYNHLKGFSSKIPISNIWGANHYILSSESKRDPYKYAIQGIID